MDLDKINEAAAKGGGGGTFKDPYQRASIGQGNNIVRLIGNVVKSVRRAWILCDDNKPRPFNSEGTVIDEIVALVMAHDRKEDPRSGEKYNEYHHKEKRAFRIVAHNDSRDDNKKGWAPSNITMMHCIPRTLEGSKWCGDNTHAMLLTKSPSSLGIGKTAMDKLKEVAAENGDPENYDVNFTKTGKGKNDTKYGCFRADPSIAGVVQGPLTEKEVEIRDKGLYDVEAIAALAAPEYIHKHLRKAIAIIDEDMGTTFLKQIEEQLPDPAEARDILPSEGEQETQAQSAPAQDSAPATQAAAPATQAAASPPVRKVAAPLPAPEPPAKKEGEEEEAACPNCGVLAPMSAEVCSKCNVKFM
jgi:hypothetical protein